MAGVRPSDFEALAERPERDVIRCAGQALDLAKKRKRQEKYNNSATVAREAAEELRRSARWACDLLYLDCRVVLGRLLLAPTRYIRFQWHEVEVVVERSRLARLRRLAQRLDGLSVHLSTDALCFRWKGGRGGLNLRFSRPIDHKADVLSVVLTPPPQPKVQPQPSLLGRVLPGILRELSQNLSP